jgi:hypothetical protein
LKKIFSEISNLNNYFLRFRLIYERNITKWRVVKLFIVKILNFYWTHFRLRKNKTAIALNRC